MSQVSDLLALLALAAVAGTWLKFTQVRERAVDEARRQCARHGLQLLDETVGLRSLRLRRSGGRRRLELGYAFEVSTNGDDRWGGRLWMRGGRLAGLSLPRTTTTPPPEAIEPPARPAVPRAAEREPRQEIRRDNVIPLRPRRSRTDQ